MGLNLRGFVNPRRSTVPRIAHRTRLLLAISSRLLLSSLFPSLPNGSLSFARRLPWKAPGNASLQIGEQGFNSFRMPAEFPDFAWGRVGR